MNTGQTKRRRQGGFTMMEIMIALLVLSVGLLGLAGLQLSSVRANNSSFFMSQAAWYAYDLADRIRANPGAVGGGTYENLDTDNVAAQNCMAGGGCNPQQLAEHDAMEWAGMVANLPAGRGIVTESDGIYSITVMWDETGEDVSACADLACFCDKLMCYAFEVEL